MVKRFTSFSIETVLQEDKLACLEAWKEYVFAGLSDGSLLLIQNRSAAGQHARWVVCDAIRGFADRHVLQLVVAHSKGLLLSLTEQGVSAHLLPSLRLNAQALRTKGANIFAWDDASCTLCVAVKRRLLVFDYEDLEIVERREVSLPGVVHSMQVVGGTLAYIGLQEEYIAVDLNTGTLVQLFASKAPHTGCTAVPPLTAGTAADGSGAGQVSAPGPPPAISAPRASSLPTGVLLIRDAQSVLMGGDGKLSRKGPGVLWSATPRVVAVRGPYAVAGLIPPPSSGPSSPAKPSLQLWGGAGATAPRGGGGAAVRAAVVEVRLLDPLSSSELVQRLEVPCSVRGEAAVEEGGAAEEDLSQGKPGAAPPAVDIVAPSSPQDGSLFVGCSLTGVVARLVAAPVQQQAAEMLALEEYEEALYLAAFIPPQEAETRRKLEDEIHLRYGRQLFGEQRFEEAMVHFGQSTLAGPAQLLSLFPSLAPPSLVAAAQHSTGGGAVSLPFPPPPREPQGGDLQAAVSTVLPYLLSFRSRLAGGTSSSAGAGDGSQQVSRMPSSLSISGSSCCGESLEEPPMSGGAHTTPAPDSKHTPAEGAGGGGEGAGADGASPPSTDPLRMLLDTALLRALLLLPDSGALLRFVERPNCVDVEEGGAALRDAGRYSELVALYQGKGRHAAALDLLRTLSQSPANLPSPPQGASAELGGLPGVWAAVRYLSSHPTCRDVGLVATHAKWILESDPDAGLEMFLGMRPPLPPSDVLPILTTYAPQLAATYLEGVLSCGTAPREQYEQELAMLYLLHIVKAQQEGRAGEEAAAQLPEYGKLKSLVGAECTVGGCGQEGGRLDWCTSWVYSLGEISQVYIIGVHPSREQILSSEHVDCCALLRVLPSSHLLDLRAVLLERLGRHLEALRIYVHQLQQLPLAEAYCDRVYLAMRTAKRTAARRKPGTRWGPAGGGGGGRCSGGGVAPSNGLVKLQPATPKGGRRQGGGGDTEEEADIDIYLLFIQVILEEPLPGSRQEYRPVQRAPEDERWAEVARLLSRKRDAIHPLRALELLPGALPLPSALPFLQGAVWGAGERRRAAAMGKSLRRGEHLQLMWQLVEAKQGSVLVTPERGCSLCYKRIGTSAFVTFPSGLLAHYSCYRRSAGAAPGKVLLSPA